MISPAAPASSLDHVSLTSPQPMSFVHRLTWYCLLLMVFLIPWGEGLYDGLARMVAMPTLGLTLVMVVLEGSHRNFSAFNLFALLLAVWYLVGIWWTPDLQWGMEILKTYIMLIMMSFMFTYLINNEYKFRWTYQSYVLGTVVATGIIFNNYLNGVTGPYYNRYTVEHIETDNMAIILALGIPMAVWLYTQYQNKLARLLNVLFIPWIFYGIFLTGTRTGLVTGMIGIMYLAFTQRKASFNLKMIYVGLAISLAVAVVSLAPKASVERIFSLGKSLKSGDLNYREVIWQHSFSAWSDNPILGNGTGSLGNVLNSYHVEFKWAHNAYIQMLTENGLVGLILYLLMLASLLYYALKCELETKFFLLTLWVTIAVSQLTLHSQNLKEIWFVWSVIAVHGYYFSHKLAQSKHVPYQNH